MINFYKSVDFKIILIKICFEEIRGKQFLGLIISGNLRQGTVKY